MRLLEIELGQGTPKDKVAFVTFTRKGAEVGIDKAIEKFGGIDSDYPWFRTLHSLAFRALNLKKTDLLSRKDYKTLSDVLGLHFVGHYTNEGVHGDDRYLFFDELMRNNTIEAETYKDTINYATAMKVRMYYKDYKYRSKKKDFTDILEDFVCAKIEIPVDVVFIDEAQDLTTLQWHVVYTAFKNAKKIYIAGDDDQAIFQWAGADIQRFLNLKSSLAPIYLNHSWRLTDEVLAVAKGITSLIQDRVKKEYSSRGERGVVEWVNDVKEIEIEQGKNYLFLCRNTRFLKKPEEFLQKKGLHYELNGTNILRITDIKSISQWEQLREVRGPLPSYLSILGQTLIDEVNIDMPWYEAFDWEEEIIEFYQEYIRKHKNLNWSELEVSARIELKEKPQFQISTIHRTKGAEADIVVLFLDMSVKTYKDYIRRPDQENRVLYVAVTRAKEKLILVNPSTKWSYKLLTDWRGDGQELFSK
jgi:superfamily I DNA/RNA helicase